MRYAQILNNKVHWIFEDFLTLDEIYAEKFNPNQIQLIDISAADFDDVREGWEYDGVNFTDPNVLTLDETRTKHIKVAGAEFARRRDAIRWVDGYGFDCQSEDMTNFMAAFTPLLVNKTGTVYYKVWTSETTKGVIERDYEQMFAVYTAVRTSQLEAYSWYEGLKGQLNAAETIAELEKIYPIKESE